MNDVNIIKYSPVKKKGVLRNGRDTPRKSNGRDAPRESNTGRDAPRESNTGRNAPGESNTGRNAQGESKVRGAQRPTKDYFEMLVSFQYLF